VAILSVHITVTGNTESAGVATGEHLSLPEVQMAKIDFSCALYYCAIHERYNGHTIRFRCARSLLPDELSHSLLTVKFTSSRVNCGKLFGRTFLEPTGL
jgi:hypothetical protein